MTEIESNTITCWCGNTHLTTYSPDYYHCDQCETLVLKESSSTKIDRVTSEEDYYGKKYWFEHQENDFGYENIINRARSDLPERDVYWLKTFLKYKLPPGKTLELGCSHGGFVAMLSWCSFDATGLELSPWIADYARKTFGIAMLVGKLEEQRLQPSSFDAIILMDVLEHLVNPLETLKYAASLLKPDGVLMVQTPCYQPKISYDELVKNNDPFLQQLKPPEHIYLFSSHSIQNLFNKFNFTNIYTEKAIFYQYDTFFLASRQEIKQNQETRIVQNLQSTPSGRLLLAMKDLDNEKNHQIDLLVKQGSILGQIEAERNLALYEIADLKDHFRKAEADRDARLEVIQQQGGLVGQLEGERNNLLYEIADLKEHFRKSEADREARLEVINQQGSLVGQLEAERNNLQFDMADLKEHFRKSEADREARLEVINQQGSLLGQLEAERNNLQYEITDLKEQFKKSEADREARLEVINNQGTLIEQLKTENNQINSLNLTLNRMLSEKEGAQVRLQTQYQELLDKTFSAQIKKAAQFFLSYCRDLPKKIKTVFQKPEK